MSYLWGWLSLHSQAPGVLLISRRYIFSLFCSLNISIKQSEVYYWDNMCFCRNMNAFHNHLVKKSSPQSTVYLIRDCMKQGLVILKLTSIPVSQEYYQITKPGADAHFFFFSLGAERNFNYFSIINIGKECWH